MYLVDRLAVECGVPSWSLMQAAGKAVAQQALALSTRGQRVVVLCGPGNNGGDGYVAAGHLAANGRAVCVMALGDLAALRGDALKAYQSWMCHPGATVEALDETALRAGDMVVDALFGAGLNRAPEGQARRMIAAVNRLGLSCVAVDVPSGVAGDSGEIWGEAMKAETTVCFFRAKPGHYLYPGKAACGRLVVADIGIPDDLLDRLQPGLMVNGPALWRLPVPGWQDHKYSRGHVTVIGSAEMSGAARLAIAAARRMGAGLVTAAVPRSALALYGADAPGALLAGVADDPAQAIPEILSLLEDPRRSVVVIGPGLAPSQATRDLVLGCLKGAAAMGRRLVLDAGALTAFQDQGDVLFQALENGGKAVLTPHDGEFVRLFPDIVQGGSRLSRALQAARRCGAVMVLKGPDSVVATPHGQAALAPFTAADLATAGSGDVLAGLIAGALAQGLESYHAACCGVWMHSEAARRFGAGLIAEDLPAGIPALLGELRLCGA
jgi:NAD(P)H-hydrate epimerase